MLNQMFNAASVYNYPLDEELLFKAAHDLSVALKDPVVGEQWRAASRAEWTRRMQASSH